jgi:nucleoid DNA-binding protein
MSTLSKTDLVAAIAEKTGKSKAETKLFLDALLETVTDELVRGNDISLIGFANLKVAHKEARTGRNPSTGETINIPAQKVVKFTAGKALKDAVNR